jgi:hypothetical protein
VPTAYAGTAPHNTWTDWGIVAEYLEESDQIVAWVGKSQVVGGDGGATLRQTWVLDMTTLVWRDGPSLAGGNTVPPASSAMVTSTPMYDPVSRTINLIGWDQVAAGASVWSFSPQYTSRGIITRHALPAMSGTILFENYYGFPFTTSKPGKHYNMAYCPLDNRIYVSGGDWLNSATPPSGIVSMNVDSGAWQLDDGLAVYPTNPSPHSAQDNMGFEWSAVRNKFLFWPGSYFRYIAPADPLAAYTYGMWMFDPVTKEWTQHLEYWDTYGEWSGNLFGGAYYPTNDTIYVINETGTSVDRYLVTDMSRPASINLGSTWLTSVGLQSASFRGMQRICNGSMYVIGTAIVTATSQVVPVMMKMNLTTFAATLCSPPTLAAGRSIVPIAVRFDVSGNKLIWPYVYEEVAEINSGILIYNTDQDCWSVDWQMPADGKFRANTVCSLPDGRIAMCGTQGAYGSDAPTHFWFYQPAS